MDEEDVQQVDAEPTPPPAADAGCLGKTIAMAGIFFSILYLLNPTSGFVELIPDNLPVVGNLDEAAVVAVFFACLRYLGIDCLPFKKK